MNYNIMYAREHFTAAIQFVNANNPLYRWDDQKLMEFIQRGAEENLKFLKRGSSDWTHYISTGGITVLYSHESHTKKGYPIIDVDILVSSHFGDSEYIYKKVRTAKVG